ncbi:GNAT family N-acetyltransferase [Lacinutrix salivirga]
MKIVQAKTKQLQDLLPLFDAYRVFYKQDSNLKAAETFLKQRLSKQDTILLIAYINNTAVGFTHLFHSFSSVSMQPLFILNDLYVAKNYRKQGIGVALLNKAKALCMQHNYKGVALQTETTNPAQHLYESMDWKRDEDLHYMWLNTDLKS